MTELSSDKRANQFKRSHKFFTTFASMVSPGSLAYFLNKNKVNKLLNGKKEND